MYLPLEYWRRLEHDPVVKGSRHGRVVTFDNAGRHFDNTAFAHLVASGWIGTTASQTAVRFGEIPDPPAGRAGGVGEVLTMLLTYGARRGRSAGMSDPIGPERGQGESRS